MLRIYSYLKISLCWHFSYWSRNIYFFELGHKHVSWYRGSLCLSGAIFDIAQILAHLARMSRIQYHLGRAILPESSQVMHICISKGTIIGSDNGVVPGRHQAIVWTNAGLLLIRNKLQWNLNQNWYIFVKIGHVTLTVIAGTTILVPSFY